MNGHRDNHARVFLPGYKAGPATDVQLQRNGDAFNMFDEYDDRRTFGPPTYSVARQ